MTRIIETFADDLILREFKPEDAQAVIDGHLELYAREYELRTEVWRSYVHSSTRDFVERFDPERDWMVVVEHQGMVKGSAAVTHFDRDTAQFRFFYLDPSLRGKGLGRKMFDYAIAFCREKNYRRIILWTFSTLYAARHLYKEKGFVITEVKANNEWGPPLIEERWDLEL